jgi:catechol 2,3-dioxygenase-like lactoylglutathione lyase family enzyme
MMTNMTAVEIKAFVPSKDFELSKRFYEDLGFELAWSSDDLAYFHTGGSSFLLQRFYMKEHAENFMMHMLVEDVESWWRHVNSQRIGDKYGVRVTPPGDRPWGIRDFTVDDPTGVLWRIGQDMESHAGIH